MQGQQGAITEDSTPQPLEGGSSAVFPLYTQLYVPTHFTQTLMGFYLKQFDIPDILHVLLSPRLIWLGVCTYNGKDFPFWALL